MSHYSQLEEDESMSTPRYPAVLTALTAILIALAAVAAVGQRTGPPPSPVPETIQATGTITIESTQGAVKIRVADRGMITLNSSGGFELKGDDDRPYAISMDSAGNIKLRGRTVSIQSDRETTVASGRAMSLSSSQTITANASTNLTLKGAQSARLEGMNTTVRAQSINKVEAAGGQVQVLGDLIKLN